MYPSNLKHVAGALRGEFFCKKHKNKKGKKKQKTKGPSKDYGCTRKSTYWNGFLKRCVGIYCEGSLLFDPPPRFSVFIPFSHASHCLTKLAHLLALHLAGLQLSLAPSSTWLASHLKVVFTYYFFFPTSFLLPVAPPVSSEGSGVPPSTLLPSHRPPPTTHPNMCLSPSVSSSPFQFFVINGKPWRLS